jgi:hypothetical protein
MRLSRDGTGQESVIPFLLFAAMFLTLFSVFYIFYSSSMNSMTNQMEVIELQTAASHATGESVWANENIVYGDSVRIPINDLKALRDTYGDDNSYVHSVRTYFLWRETLTLFSIDIDHDTDIHGDNQLTINITAHEEIDGEMYGIHGASWQMFEAPGYIHVGKTWFETYGLVPGDISHNLDMIIADWVGYTPQISTGWPANVEILVSGITRQTGTQGSSIDKIWGEVTLDWGTYAGSIGEIGWVRTLGDLLTCNLPGTPSMVRIIFAVPILLCVGYITALFVKQVFFSL